MGSVKASFEIFDHTADAGIHARAPSRSGLLEPAGQALYAIIGELVPCGDTGELAFDLTGGDAPVLLRDYLGELLILFERDQRIVTSVHVVTFEDDCLRATARTRRLDAAKSILDREVKAITYHELEIRAIDDGYEATLIVDI